MRLLSTAVFIYIILEALVCQETLLVFEEISGWVSNFSATVLVNVNALILLFKLLFHYGIFSTSENPLNVFHFIILKTT